jgi:hypothetical protein
MAGEKTEVLKRPGSTGKMWCSFLAGILCGMYVEQNYDTPNVKNLCQRLMALLKTMEKN